jgi:hypothetical protein
LSNRAGKGIERADEGKPARWAPATQSSTPRQMG